jgi:stage II sporulation protein D
VTTYFFASSGGHTEDVQNVFLGVEPEAWLQGVPDPYDDSDGNPFFRWKVSLSLAKAARKLHGLVDGSFVGIKVLKRGVSPRVVSAEVVGSGGSTLVSGDALEHALGLMSTYLAFTTITATGTTTTGSLSTPTPKPTPQPVTTPSPTGTGTTTTGGSGTGGGGLVAGREPRRARVRVRISGTSFPERARRRVAVQRLGAHGFRTVARGRTNARGAYSLALPGPGRYRVRVSGTIGPTLAIH